MVGGRRVKKGRGLGRVAALFGVGVSLLACQTDTLNRQTAALTLAPESMAQRQMQQRRFDTQDDSAMLAAATAVIQDLGFSIDEATARSGLLVASKNRDAMESQQVAGQLVLAALIAAMGGVADPQWDQVQKIRVSIMTQKSADGAAVVVRATFQRLIWNNKAQLSRVEALTDPVIYQGFFDKLSQAVFLEAHDI